MMISLVSLNFPVALDRVLYSSAPSISPFLVPEVSLDHGTECRVEALNSVYVTLTLNLVYGYWVPTPQGFKM
jgi:hypothetical protein